MGRRKKTEFEDSLNKNQLGYMQYFNRLCELSMSMFEWKNLPDTVDLRYLEMALFREGCAVYFREDDVGDLCLTCINEGRFDVYGYPTKRRAYSKYNNFQKELDDNDSVIIWNNMLRTNSMLDVLQFSRKLYELDRIIEVNARAQKTPVLIKCSEKEKLTLLNVYKEFDGNAPVIFGYDGLDQNSLNALTTGAPYVADKLYTLKTQIWNEALTYLGISNINIQKKERLITDEVTRNEGGTIANRYSRLESRRIGAEKINKMFGTNIEVNYREDFQQVDNDTIPEEAGADTIGGADNE